jgi:hypothetical protein
MADETAVRTTRVAGHAVAIGALLAWPLSYALTYVLAIGLPWVGSSDVPAIVLPLVAAPAVIVGLAGLIVGILGIKRRVWSATAEGGFAILAGAAIFMVSSLQVGMLSIT